MRLVGETDRLKLDQYSDAVRSVEQQIRVAEQQPSKELPAMEKPIGIPTQFSDYARLMLDLQVLAFQGDVTRVGTFMVGHEMGGRAYPELGFGISIIHSHTTRATEQRSRRSSRSTCFTRRSTGISWRRCSRCRMATDRCSIIRCSRMAAR